MKTGDKVRYSVKTKSKSWKTPGIGTIAQVLESPTYGEIYIVKKERSFEMRPINPKNLQEL